MGSPTSRVLVLVLVAVSCATKDPCFVYENIGETDAVHEIYHRHGGLIHNEEEDLNCRRYPPTEQWYRPRFNQVTDLTTSCADRVKCGTVFPIWMTERIPYVWEGVENRTVCRRSFDDCCASDWNIQVKNCGEYRVYRLLPVDFCSAAYCFEKEREQKSMLMDHVIIGSAASVLLISATAIIVTCLYRRRKIRLLQEKWAQRRREMRDGERKSPRIVGENDSVEKKTILLFTTAPNLMSATAPETTHREFSETPRAWENADPVQEKVPL